MREGDVLVITKLDRMARSVLDLNIIAKRLLDKQVDLKVLTQDIDTTTIYGKLVFNVLGAVAQFERELINERAKEGIIKAKARGVKFGRSKKVNAEMAPNQPQAAVQSVVGHYSISSVLHPSDSYDLLIYLCYRMAH